MSPSTVMRIWQLFPTFIVLVAWMHARAEPALPLSMEPRIVDRTCTEVWPAGLAEQGEWRVRIAFRVSATGDLLETRLVQPSGSDLLDQSSLRAFTTCKFIPGQVQGKAVEGWSEFSRLYQRSAGRQRVDAGARRERHD